MRWCCAELEHYIDQATEKGFGIVYADFAKVGKFFLLHCHRSEAGGDFPTDIRIRFCPWCGANLDGFPK